MMLSEIVQFPALIMASAADPTAHVKDAPVSIPGLEFLSIHTVQVVIATSLLLFVMSRAAKAIATGPESQGHDRYITKGRLNQLIEVITIYMRDEVLKPVLGEQTSKFFPYLLSLFFFILIINLLGLVPLLDLQHLIGYFATGGENSHWAVLGSTPTGNLSVTAALSIVAFFVINIHGIKQNGLGGYLHHLLGGAPAYLAPIMVPVELLSMFIKPGALAIRLFANMLAGHTLMAVLAGFGLMALGNLDEPNIGLGVGITVVSGLFSFLITFLELFVAFLQAFIFMFLTTIFIGQMSHHDHDHEHEHPAHDDDPAHHMEFEAEVSHA